MFSLFQVVGISLVLSWIVAVLFTPYIGFKLLKEHAARRARRGRGLPARLLRALPPLRRLPAWSTARWVIGITLAAVRRHRSLLFKLVPQQFFPASDRPGADGRPVDAAGRPRSRRAQREVRDARGAAAQGDPDVVAVTSYVGNGSPRFYLPLDVQTPNLNLGELMVMTKGGEARERVLGKIAAALRRTSLPNVRGRVNRLENGPPVGYPVQFRVFGRTTTKVREIADQVAGHHAHRPARAPRQPGLGRADQARAVDVDQDKARALGISSRQIKAALEGSLSGTPITQYREGDQDIDVVARLVAAGAHRPEQPEGREDLPARRQVRAGLAGGAPDAGQRGQPAVAPQPGADADGARRPRRGRGARRDAGAACPASRHSPSSCRSATASRWAAPTSRARKAQTSIFAVMPVTIIVVLLLLMVQLHDMKKMGLVLLTAPLGLIGVSAILAAFRIPFGFVAMLGVIALAGMIIRNSVILVVQIDQRRGGRRAAVDRHRRVGGAPAAADRADRAGRDPRDGAAHALGLLGPDGLGHHGRTGRRHAADARLPAGAVRRLVRAEAAAPPSTPNRRRRA